MWICIYCLDFRLRIADCWIAVFQRLLIEMQVFLFISEKKKKLLFLYSTYISFRCGHVQCIGIRTFYYMSQNQMHYHIWREKQIPFNGHKYWNEKQIHAHRSLKTEDKAEKWRRRKKRNKIIKIAGEIPNWPNSEKNNWKI